MPCRPIKTPEGFTAIVCGPRGRRRRCAYCSSEADRLCDFPVTRNSKPGTCDRPICSRCSWRISGDRDLCREHTPLWDPETDGPRAA